jgi:hypothetical protein
MQRDDQPVDNLFLHACFFPAAFFICSWSNYLSRVLTEALLPA